MQKRKVYSQDTINVLEVEINKFREIKDNELTLDKILLQAKKMVVELIELKCTAKEIAAIFNNAGIKVGVNKIKKMYFTSLTRKNPKP
jgi:hypothetical protein